VLTRQIESLEGGRTVSNRLCCLSATYRGETAAYNDERHEAGGGEGEVEQPGTGFSLAG